MQTFLLKAAIISGVWPRALSVAGVIFCLLLSRETTAQCTNPMVNVSPTAPQICSGSNVSLTAGGATTYAWYPSVGLNATSGANVIASPAVTTTYTVVGSVAGGCSGSQTVTVTVNPQPSLSYTSGSSSCATMNPGGSVALSVSSGTSPYSYIWSTGATTQNITNVAASNYFVTVTDAKGCTANLVASVSSSGGPSFNAAVVQPSCGLNNGSIDIIPTSGNNVVFVWSNGATTEDISNLAAGMYYFTVTKSNGCATAMSFMLVNAVPPTLTSNTTTATCSQPNGGVTLGVSGGTPPFVYSWSNGATTQNISNVAPGSYTVTVSSGNGCTITHTATVANAAAPTFTLTPTNPTCAQANGSVTLSNFSGGTWPFAYAWNNGATAASLSSLASGMYSVTVTDLNGCTYAQSTSISNSSPPSVSPVSTNSTCGLNNGSIAANASGGATPYSYLWSNGATTAIANALAPGTYGVTVTSANGCTASGSATVVATTPPTASLTLVNASCELSNGSVSASVSNGTPPFSYTWNTGAATQNIVNQPAGSYSVTVTDNGGCTASASTSLSTTTPVSMNAATVANAGCGLSNGSATANVANGVSPYAYAWSNGAATQTAAGIPAGAYTVTVTAVNGCTVSQAVNVPNATAQTLTPNVLAHATCNNANGSASVGVSGGVSPFTFSWSSGATTNTAINLAGGTYTVTVTGSNGCVATANVTINNAPPPSYSLNAQNSTCGYANGGVTLAFSAGNNTPLAFAWSNGATTQNLANVPAGNYTVTVTNGSGCTASQPITVNNTAGPTSLTITPAQTTCGLDNGTAFGSFTGGTAPFVFNWSNGDNTASVSNLAPLSYQLTVTDDNGCTISGSTTITAIAPPDLSTSTIDAICNGANGSVNLTVNNGTAPFAFAWSNGGTAEDLLNVPAAAYTVTVTDANNCTATAAATVSNTPVPALSLTPVSSTCGYANGAVNAAPSSGVTPYAFAWSTGATTQNIANIPAGVYTLTVTDANSCTIVQSTTVTNISGPGLLLSETEPTCGLDNGAAMPTVVGGTGPFAFAWSNGSTNASITAAAPGTYHLTVTDANGCSITQSAVLSPSTAPSLSFNITHTTCNLSNGSAAANITNGNPPYTLAWSNGATTASITSLAAGTYGITVTDDIGCTASAAAVVNASLTPQLVLSPTNASCGLANGSVGSTVSQMQSPFTYSWTTGAATSSIANVLHGTYTLTVTDALGCSVSSSATLTTTALPSPSALPTHTTCSLNNGSASASAANGIAPYTYSWSTGAAAPAVNALAPGAYTVTVTTADGCTASATTTVNASLPLQVNLSTTTAHCNQSTGSVTSAVSDGTAPFQYLWNTAATTANLSNVPGGSYNVTVTDAIGCSATAAASVSDAAGPSSIQVTIAHSTCGQANGSASIAAVTGGASPYTFVWSNGATQSSVNALAAGTYSVTATDAYNCAVSESFTINTTTIPSVNVTPTHTSCALSNGAASANAINGTAPHGISWSNGAAGQNINSLAAGVYQVTVTDAAGCTTIGSTSVNASTNPSASLAATHATCGYSNGSVNTTPSLGVPPYSFQWSNGQTTQHLSSVLSGTYSLTVTDAVGCTGTASVVVNDSPVPSVSLTPSNANCNQTNGSVTHSIVAAGTPPYAFNWSNGSVAQNLVNIAAGAYSVTVTDSKGCTAAAAATVSNVSGPQISTNPVASNCALPNGSVSMSASGGVVPYNIQWSNGATTQNISSVASGVYGVTVTDAMGCSAVSVANVPNNASPAVSISTNPSTCGSPNGNASAAVTAGGSASMTFSWSNGATAQSIASLPAAPYSVTVTDGNGCTASAASAVNNIAGPGVSLTPAGASCGYANGSVTLVTSNGTAPFSYSWSNGAVTQNISNVPAGTYAVTVTDANNCTAVGSSSVPGTPVLSINALVEHATCGLNNASINVGAGGGTAPFSFNWNNGNTTGTLASLNTGTFSVTITDGAGCTVGDAYTITTTTVPSLSVSGVSNANCFQADGSAQVTVTGGTSPYAYAWSNGETENYIDGVVSGNYGVTVTDAVGCTAAASVSIADIPAPTLDVTPTATTCTQANGIVTLFINGGIGPFDIQWSNGTAAGNLSNIAHGIYGVTVTDANGCVATGNTTVIDQPAPATSFNVTNATCGQNNGGVFVTPSGYGPLSFNWSNGTTTQHLSNVNAGSYTLTVTDVNGCTGAVNTTVTGTTVPAVSPGVTNAACGQSNGAVQLSISTAGTLPYSFSWSNGATSQHLSNIPTNAYSVTLTDAAGCTTSASANVQDESGPSLSVIALNSSCGYANGSVQLDANGGALPYAFQWSNGATAQNLSNVLAGAYSVTVTDAAGCIANGFATVNDQAAPTAALTPTGTQCGLANGLVESNANGNSPLAYLWNNGETGSAINAVAAGSFALTVTDVNGCTATAQTIVSGSSSPSIALSSTDAACGMVNGLVEAAVTNGTGPYTFIWSTGSVAQNIYNLAAGTYILTVTDSAGCTETNATAIGMSPAVLFSLNATNSTCGNANGLVESNIASGTSPFIFYWSNGSTATDLIDVPAGAYAATVTDGNGCSASGNAIVTDEGAPSLLFVSTNATCGLANGAVDLSVNGIAPPYVFAWNDGSTLEDLQNAAEGQHTVTVTDANGCQASLAALVQNTAGPAVALLVQNSTCSDANGVVEAVVSNGTAPFAFQWSNSAITNLISNLAAAAYHVTVSDANGCTALASAIVDDAPAPQLTVSIVNAACQSANGEAVVAANGTPPFSFSWSNGAGTAHVQNLAPGNYSVTVMDANGCTSESQIGVTAPEPHTVSFEIVNSTCGDANGTAAVVVAGGASPFAFQWSNAGTDSVAQNLSAGAYQVTVTDANNCIVSTSVIISTTLVPDVQHVIASATCGNDNGLVEVSVTQGQTPYTCLWSNGTSAQNLENVFAGNYAVTVTDQLGCTASISVSVNNADGPQLSLSAVDADCQQTNGLVNLTVTGGAQPYTFQWNNGATTEDIDNLAAGSYSVTVTDANGCFLSESTTVNTPSVPSLSVLAVNTSCGLHNGLLTTGIADGIAPFAFTWSNGKATASLMDVAPGSYSVTLTDGAGCTATDNATVGASSVVTVQVSVQNTSCGNSNGSALISSANASQPYTLLWSNGESANPIESLSSGVYHVTLTDAQGCTANASGNVLPSTSPAAAANAQEATCGQANGGAALTVNNGVTPYVFEWSNGSTAQHLTNAPAGPYTVTVIDAASCSIVTQVSVVNTNGPELTYTYTNPVCNEPNGSITTQIDGGTPPYAYAWSNGQTTAVAFNIAQGTHTVTVSDQTGCNTIASIVLADSGSPAVTFDIIHSTCGAANGSIGTIVNGGTLPYGFVWNNAATTASLLNAGPGSYSVTVTDANGCSTSHQGLVTTTAVPNLTFNVQHDVCSDGIGSVQAVVTNGTLPYSFSWNNGNTFASLQNLFSGFYDITISDAAGCIVAEQALVNDLPCGLVAIAQGTATTCGLDNGSLSIDIQGGVPPYTLQWSNGETNSTLQNLGPALYYVTVTDAQGITAVSQAQIDGSDAPELNSSEQHATCGQANGFVLLNLSGGTQPYAFQWSNNATTQHITNLDAGQYAVTVTDGIGCTATASTTIINPDGPVATLSATHASCALANGAVQCIVSGGTLPYAFQWSNGAGTQHIANISDGSYTVTVTDAIGCQTVQTIAVNSTPVPQLALQTTPSTCGNANGAVTTAVTAGTSPFAYAWSNGASTQHLNGLVSGAFGVTVSDAAGCTASASASVTAVAPVSIAHQVVHAACGQSTGSVHITVSNGTQPFVFNWSNGATGQNLTQTAAGLYTLTVTDANNCTLQQTFALNDIAGPEVFLTAFHPVCNQSNGSITTVVTNGTQPFAFSWSHNATTQHLNNAGAGSYLLTVSDANNCTAIASATLVNAGAPQLAYASTPSGCTVASGSVVLSVSGGTQPYTHLWNNGATTTQLTNVLYGNYHVTVLDANGCSAALMTNVPVVNAPLVQTVSGIASCGAANGTANVIASNGVAPYTYQWSTGGSGTNITGLVEGLYEVTVTDASGCSSYAQAIVDATYPPELTLTAFDTKCSLPNGLVASGVVNGLPPYQYQWNNGASIGTINFVPAGNYEVTVTDANGCTATAATAVGAIPIDSLQLSTSPSATCSGDAFAMTASNCVQYTWAPGSGLSSQSGSNVTVTVFAATTYTVVGTDANGCTTIRTFSTTALPKADAQIAGGPYEDCPGTKFPLISYTQNAFAHAWFLNGQWLAGSDTTVAPMSGAYDVTLVAYAQNGCNDTAHWPLYLQVREKPTADFFMDSIPGLLGGYSFTNLSTGADTYTWWFGDGHASTEEHPQHQYSDPSVYTVTLIARNGVGCYDTVSYPLYTPWPHRSFVPNTFTPNGDGRNDVFTVYGTGLGTVRLRVYDRWGTMIFDASGDVPGWDGTFKGRPMMSGTYVYVAEIKYWDGVTEKRVGDINLLR